MEEKIEKSIKEEEKLHRLFAKIIYDLGREQKRRNIREIREASQNILGFIDYILKQNKLNPETKIEITKVSIQLAVVWKELGLRNNRNNEIMDRLIENTFSVYKTLYGEDIDINKIKNFIKGLVVFSSNKLRGIYLNSIL